MIVIRTLGTAQIEIGGTRILPTSPRKFALLLYLAAERGRPVSRATLQDLIFPDQTDKNARHSLRELVYQFRQMGLPLLSSDEGLEARGQRGRVVISTSFSRRRASRIINCGRWKAGFWQDIRQSIPKALSNGLEHFARARLLSSARDSSQN